MASFSPKTKLLLLMILSMAMIVIVFEFDSLSDGDPAGPSLQGNIIEAVQNFTKMVPLYLNGIVSMDNRTDLTPVKHPCTGIPNRWSIMYNPSLFRGRSGFSLVNPYIEPQLTCEQRHLDIIVVVNTAAHSKKHREMRSAIRQTWANSSSANNRKSFAKWLLFFSLGLTSDADSNHLNEQEAEKNNDVIIGNFSDTYRNIPIKTFMSHLWAFSKFSFKYVLKTDDDIYVRVPVLHQWLISEGAPKRFYGGYINRNPIVFRHPASPWYISYEQFNESRWPDFCHGAFQVLSIDLMPAYLYYTQFRKPFHTDDAFMGVIARDFGVHVTDIPGVGLSGVPKTDCEFSKRIAIGDNINPKTMHLIDESYKRLRQNKSACN